MIIQNPIVFMIFWWQILFISLNFPKIDKFHFDNFLETIMETTLSQCRRDTYIPGHHHNQLFFIW